MAALWTPDRPIGETTTTDPALPALGDRPRMPKVQMPQLGESVAEGTIGKWLKQPGDHVDKYEPIVEVITDKVNAEVPSPYEGTLTEILVQEGETVPNNTEIAVIEAVGDRAVATGEAPTTQGAAAADAPAAVATAEALADEPAPQAGTGPAGSDESPRRTFEQPTAPPAPAAVATAEALADEPAPQAGTGPAGSDESPGRTFEQPTAQPAQASSPASVSVTTAVAAPTMPGTNGNGNGNGNGAGTYSGPTTPAGRRLGREKSIDLSMIARARPNGRGTREDGMKFVGTGGGRGGPQQGHAPTHGV